MKTQSNKMLISDTIKEYLKDYDHFMPEYGFLSLYFIVFPFR